MLYRMISANTAQQLTESIKLHLDEGWELYGHPCVIASSEGPVPANPEIKIPILYQAVTRKDKV